jgi:uncharacterized membrane protein YdjX (TVP38/TMEM64 family)
MDLRKSLLLIGTFAVLAAMYAFDLHHLLTLASLKANHQMLQKLAATHPVSAAVAFITIYILQAALSLPGAAILSLAAGALFGPVLGTFYAVVAATIGAALAFLAARYLLRDLVIARFGPRLETVNRELEARGFNYLLFLRLVPLFPFFLINLAAGLTRLPLGIFVGGTLLGIIPGGFVFVNAGASLATITSLADVASPRVLGSFGLLGCFALLPAVYFHAKGRIR